MYLDDKKTERLIIRELNERDISVWTDFFLDQSSFEFIGLDPDISPCDHSKNWINRQLKRYSNNEYGLLALIEKSEMVMVGQAGLITMNVENDRELELGYHIIEKYRGKGYALEAAEFFRDYVFENKLADTFIAVVHVDNVVSQGVASRLGLKRSGETICMNKPSYRYAISRSEWQKLK